MAEKKTLKIFDTDGEIVSAQVLEDEVLFHINKEVLNRELASGNWRPLPDETLEGGMMTFGFNGEKVQGPLRVQVFEAIDPKLTVDIEGDTATVVIDKVKRRGTNERPAARRASKNTLSTGKQGHDERTDDKSAA